MAGTRRTGCSRRAYPAIHQGLDHPEPRRVISEMAGTRRTGYLEVAPAYHSRDGSPSVTAIQKASYGRRPLLDYEDLAFSPAL